MVLRGLGIWRSLLLVAGLNSCLPLGREASEVAYTTYIMCLVLSITATDGIDDLTTRAYTVSIEPTFP